VVCLLLRFGLLVSVADATTHQIARFRKGRGSNFGCRNRRFEEIAVIRIVVESAQMGHVVNGRFPTTSWAMLDEAKDIADADYRAAMNRFIASYWRPIHFYFRAKGYETNTAEDLTQEFLLRLLQRDWLHRADASRGRFRTFLLTVLTRFLADQRGGRAPRQKQFDRSLVSISTLIGDCERSFEPPDNTTPEALFMSKWAHALLDEVCAELKSWCAGRGRPEWYQIFADHHFPPSEHQRETQDHLAARFQCSRDQIRYAIEQTNNQFINLFRTAVAEQVGSPADIDAEIQEIEQLLSRELVSIVK